MNELTTTEKKELLSSAQNFLQHAKQYIKEIGDTFFLVGCHLYEAQIYHYVETLGYNSIEELAEAELDLSKSSTYNLINVFKRFCDRDEYGNHKIWIKPAFRKYKYSQLVEMEKAYCLDNNIEKEIPPSTPVRVLKEYIKYLNKNPGNHKHLPEWKAEQEQTSVLPPVSDNNPIKEEPADTVPDEPQPNTDVNNVAPTAEQPAETVQTFGLPTCAKTEEKTPKYNFSTRAGVREFLKDCLHWKEKECYSPFIGCHYYMLKNKRRIYVYVQRTASKNSIDGIYEVIHRFFIDLNQYSNIPVEITKEQFEQYCAEHKDEL